MKKTENLNLNVFEGADPVLAERFNENTQILEREVSCRIAYAYGTYAGDGNGQTTLTFDRRPLAVIVGNADFSAVLLHGVPYSGQIRAQGTGGPVCGVSWGENSVTFTQMDGWGTYYYLALLEA